ncbi:MAG: DUF2059 domain-containing protein [Azoarcus sp.]|nr:DUF2059 domain-containing protein [Azoarcus sp.]
MKNRMKNLVLLLLLAVSSIAMGADRAEKIARLMEAQGLAQTFEQQMQMGREACKKQADDMLSQVFVPLRITPEIEAKFKQAASDFITAAQPTWTGKDVAEIWAKYYGENFTDAELDQLLAYYTSPLAQKEVAASRTALVQFNAYFLEQYQPVQKSATEAFIQRIQAIVEECNCKI